MVLSAEDEAATRKGTSMAVLNDIPNLPILGSWKNVDLQQSLFNKLFKKIITNAEINLYR